MSLVSKGLTLRSLDEEKRSVDFVASTDAIDSYGDIVEQVWRLDRFLDNPVILFGHNSRELPIGKATRCEVADVNGRRQLECTVQIATKEANPLAENVWQSLVQGTLRAVSVGFMPNEYRWEMRDGKDVFVLSDNELHEISVVPIPANPEALAKMKAKALAAAGHDNDPTRPQGTENEMNEKEMQERVAKADAEKALAEKQANEAKTSLAATETKLVKLDGITSKLVSLVAPLVVFKATESREDQLVGAVEGIVKETSDLREKTIDQEVEALVGVKITPAEKADFVELRKANPTLFAKMIGQKPEMKQLGGPVIKDDTTAPPPVVDASTKANGSGLNTKIYGA